MSTQISIRLNTGTIPYFIVQAIERKRIIKSYMKGEISKDELTSHGIRFANPFSLCTR